MTKGYKTGSLPLRWHAASIFRDLLGIGIFTATLWIFLLVLGLVVGSL